MTTRRARRPCARLPDSQYPRLLAIALLLNTAGVLRLARTPATRMRARRPLPDHHNTTRWRPRRRAAASRPSQSPVPAEKRSQLKNRLGHQHPLASPRAETRLPLSPVRYDGRVVTCHGGVKAPPAAVACAADRVQRRGRRGCVSLNQHRCSPGSALARYARPTSPMRTYSARVSHTGKTGLMVSQPSEGDHTSGRCAIRCDCRRRRPLDLPGSITSSS